MLILIVITRLEKFCDVGLRKICCSSVTCDNVMQLELAQQH